MSKRILTILLFILIGTNTYAQRGKRKGNKFFLNTGIDYHLNSGDISFEVLKGSAWVKAPSPYPNILRSPNNIGGKVGLELFRVRNSGFLVGAAFDVKVIRQKLLVRYDAAQFGFEGSNYRYEGEIKFTNIMMDWKAKLGYSIPVGSHKSAIDLPMVIILNTAINGKNNDGGEPVYGQVNPNSQYKDLMMHTQTGWGSKKITTQDFEIAPVNLMLGIQPAYRFLSGGKYVKVGLDFSMLVRGNANNDVRVMVFDNNRISRGTAVFDDKHIAIGVFAGIEL